MKDLRKDYSGGELLEKDASPNPGDQFLKWFNDALGIDPIEANAMTLCTLGLDGTPAGRVVLLKEMDEKGFVFYTNYDSRKGRELLANPKASLVFWWRELQRQVRIEGTVEKVDRATTLEYFDTRPYGSRIGAIVSPQSSVISDRETLDKMYDATLKLYEGIEHPVAPEHWGGIRLVPKYYEFWQGRSNRLHDRLAYTQLENGWRIERLAP